MESIKCCAVIMAAGSGQRMGANTNKVFLLINDKPVIYYTLEAFQNSTMIESIVIVTRRCDIQTCDDIVKKYNLTKVKAIVVGGDTRQESVRKGLDAVENSYNIISIHDGARALVSKKEIENSIKDAISFGAAAVGVKSKDTLKKVNADGFILHTIDRENTYHIQTPQVFERKLILDAHEYAQKMGYTATDDCALLELCGGKIKLTDGSYENIKLTTPEDMEVAETILRNREYICRT